MYVNAPPPPWDRRANFYFGSKPSLEFVFRTAVYDVEYPSYPEMTGYHIFDNLLVKYSEQNYYLFKLLHIEPM